MLLLNSLNKPVALERSPYVLKRSLCSTLMWNRPKGLLPAVGGSSVFGVIGQAY